MKDGQEIRTAEALRKARTAGNGTAKRRLGARAPSATDLREALEFIRKDLSEAIGTLAILAMELRAARLTETGGATFPVLPPGCPAPRAHPADDRSAPGVCRRGDSRCLIEPLCPGHARGLDPAPADSLPASTRCKDGFGWSNGVTLQPLRLYGPGAGR